MMTSELGIVQPTEKKRYWIPLAITKEHHPFLPEWLSHLLLVFSFGSLTTTILLVGGHRQEKPLVSMIRTHSFSIFKPTLRPKKDIPTQNELKIENNNSLHILRHPIIRSVSKPIEEPSMQTYSLPITDKIDSPVVWELQTFSQPTSIETQFSILEKIRTDPKRIYLGRRIVIGDIVFEFRNASEHGIELYIRNDDNAHRTYYFPKVVIDGATSSFYGPVLFPGASRYGWIVVPNVRNKSKVTVEMSVAGGKKVKQKLNLDW